MGVDSLGLELLDRLACLGLGLLDPEKGKVCFKLRDANRERGRGSLFVGDLGLLDHEGAEDLVVDCHVLAGAQVGAGSL